MEMYATNPSTKGAAPWRRPWIAPLAAVVIIFVAFSVPPYLTGDPAQSRVPASFSAHYPLLVAHVCFGTVALFTVCLQIWPWFRAHYPTAHRRVGRIYIFGGVLPGALMALPIGAMGPFGPMARVSNVLLASLWLTCTFIGYRMARQRRYQEHRRWMIRSFALTASIITNRVWAIVAYVVLVPQLETTFRGSEELLRNTAAGLATWLGWVIPLLFAEWWLERSSWSTPRARTIDADPAVGNSRVG
jgi:uncharacterized membrane protein YozB (DUF420 family)